MPRRQPKPENVGWQGKRRGIVLDHEEMIVCERCWVPKPRGEYRKDSKYRDNIALYCKDCARQMDRGQGAFVGLVKSHMRVHEIAKPNRACVPVEKRRLWDRYIQMGRRWLVGTPDQRLFWWGPQLKEITGEEWWEWIPTSWTAKERKKAVDNTPKVNDETSEMMKFWDDVIAQEERS